MAEIPSALSEAFKQAIVVCYDWSGDDRQPPAVGVAWDPRAEPDPQHAEALCGLVSSFKDVMPGPRCRFAAEASVQHRRQCQR